MIEIIGIGLNVLNFACFSFMSLLFKKVYFIRIPNYMTPWSSANNRENSLRYLQKVGIVLFQCLIANQFDTINSYIPLFALILIGL